MAARLEWAKDVLMLGPFGLLRLESVGGSPKRASLRVALVHRVSEVPEVLLGLLENRWETDADAKQDAESEVRRLLKAAGVEVEP